MLSAITLNEVPGSNPCFHNTRRGPAHDDIEDARRTFFEAVRGGDDYLLRSVVACFWRIAAMAYRLGQAIVVTTRRGIGGNIFLATTSAAPFFSCIGFSEVPRAEVPAAELATSAVHHLPLVGDHHDARQASNLTTDQDHD
ncbi:GNAT family N-acetyltransferase [Agrobacterium tumefaciens]|uniref:GNAT family N-acetyltransferase n=1 Tax=Agrobacterium tumefaciens TaxID=358 RepID=UPI00287EEFEB|nr:GNAT family N-acetyltransferase [Agrobacterium tumefaciens]MDS7595194.1 GNAT family N-acetyltransferase [Agrobacterium tumefaciens]